MVVVVAALRVAVVLQEQTGCTTRSTVEPQLRLQLDRTAQAHHGPGTGVRAHQPADGCRFCPRSLSPTGEPGLPAAPERRGRRSHCLGRRPAAAEDGVPGACDSFSDWNMEEQLHSLGQLINKVAR